MDQNIRLRLLPALLLLAGAPLVVAAESPMPDPIAPAVLGRPLDQIKPVRPKRTAESKPVVKPRQATAPVTASRVAAPATAATATGVLAQDPSTTKRPVKQAVDDRIDPRMRLDDVGKGTHFARKALGTGAYIGEKHRTAVRQYYASQPASAKPANWQVGEPVPSGVRAAPLPQGLLAKLPPLPPGHDYVQLGGEVVLIASGSKMVVDGISRRER